MAARDPFKSRNLRTIKLWEAEAALASSLVRLLFGLQGMLKLLHVDEAPSNLVREYTSIRVNWYEETPSRRPLVDSGLQPRI